jgi:hypothetical protein
VGTADTDGVVALTGTADTAGEAHSRVAGARLHRPRRAPRRLRTERQDLGLNPAPEPSGGRVAPLCLTPAPLATTDRTLALGLFAPATGLEVIERTWRLAFPGSVSRAGTGAGCEAGRVSASARRGPTSLASERTRFKPDYPARTVFATPPRRCVDSVSRAPRLFNIVPALIDTSSRS